jgi:cobalamin biosynthesis protein CobT
MSTAPPPNHKIVASRGRHSEPFSSREINTAKKLSRQFRESIKVQCSHTFYWDHGYRAGELHESNLWQIASGIENARPFSTRESIDIPDFHIGILVDCSGSMSGNVSNSYNGESIMSAARTLAYGFAQALDEIEGVHVAVCGHTEEGGNVHLLMVKRARTDLKVENFSSLTAQSGNLDGLAVVAFCREMRKDMMPGEKGILVLISDGAPCHSALIMKKSFDIAKRTHDITVLPIGVGRSLASRRDICDEHYGPGNYVVAADVVSSAPAIISKANSYIAELKPM